MWGFIQIIKKGISSFTNKEVLRPYLCNRLSEQPAYFGQDDMEDLRKKVSGENKMELIVNNRHLTMEKIIVLIGDL